MPKSVPREPKSAPRAPQERPRAPQEPPKSAKRRPGEPSGTISRLERSKKAPCESSLSLDLVEKRFRNDFRLIFEACAQTPNLEFEATLWRFSRFFKNRIVFARVGQLERKSNKKTPKSIPRRAQTRPKTTQKRSSEALEATSNGKKALTPSSCSNPGAQRRPKSSRIHDPRPPEGPPDPPDPVATRSQSTNWYPYICIYIYIYIY